jgi:hypothetical protein
MLPFKKTQILYAHAFTTWDYYYYYYNKLQMGLYPVAMCYNARQDNIIQYSTV